MVVENLKERDFTERERIDRRGLEQRGRTEKEWKPEVLKERVRRRGQSELRREWQG